MGSKHTIIKGAFILTATGFITRIIGFFYRIFLSHTFGEEGVGIYQLIFPVFALGFSLTCAGIETAISRNVAAKSSLHQHDQADSMLYIGCGLSISLSFLFMIFIQRNSHYIAHTFLNEPRCQPLLLILSYCFPFAALHSCICGYFLGLKRTKIPALSQLIEQLFRVFGVFLLYKISTHDQSEANISIAVAGLFLGEFASSLFCLFSYHHLRKRTIYNKLPAYNVYKNTKALLSLSIPLTCNRAMLNILQSVEAISIPLKLQTFGFNTAQSLSIYGVLTGMALPCVLFPSAITNSIASMMLPTVAEIQTQNNRNLLVPILKKVIFCCFTLGIICGFGLIIFGAFIGKCIFHSQLAGNFIMTLAWMCPFLYTNGNLISIINGLGHTLHSFIFNSVGLTIRIISVFFFIPIYGIRGYLFGLLISQLIIFLLCFGYLLLYPKKDCAL